MSTETLYDLGWRQGSVLQTPISTVSLVSGPKSGTVKESVQSHELWAVVTQECGLARARVTQNTPSVELRQVHDTAPPITWGIRTRKFLLSETPSHYLIDDKPIAFVSPRLLSDAEVVKRLYTLEDRRVLALKTWLGNRYDRPEHLPWMNRAGVEASQGDQVMAKEPATGVEHQNDERLLARIKPRRTRYIRLPVSHCLIGCFNRS